MPLITRLLRFFFHQLYHPFAWSYDLVAAVVSVGRWNVWVDSVIPFIPRGRVLELGHGPGHLQRSLTVLGFSSVGLDESPQMSSLAKRRLRRDGLPVRLLRGIAQQLPFASQAFDTILSTFPAEYIIEAQALSEVYRVLRAGGTFIVMPVAWITGRSGLDRLAAWLFRVTGESPRRRADFETRLAALTRVAGFEIEFIYKEIRSSTCMIVVGKKQT